jgi:hypothetical protein
MHVSIIKQVFKITSAFSLGFVGENVEMGVLVSKFSRFLHNTAR